MSNKVVSLPSRLTKELCTLSRKHRRHIGADCQATSEVNTGQTAFPRFYGMKSGLTETPLTMASLRRVKSSSAAASVGQRRSLDELADREVEMSGRRGSACVSKGFKLRAPAPDPAHCMA